MAALRFDVALSFPGEHRDYVAAVANALLAHFPQDRILYDKFYEAEFARPDLDVYLPSLYRTQSELIVLFLCPEYSAKRWCRLEWRHIRQLLAKVDSSRIMFLRHGYAGDFSEIGILDGDGTINFESRPPAEIAKLIQQRFTLEQARRAPPKSPGNVLPAKVDISRIAKYAPAELVGRETELKLLSDTWAKVQSQEPGRPHVLTFVALGGEGKTSLVAKWAAELAAQDWPGCEAAFAWSFYSQGTKDQVAASSDLFLKEALTFFGDAELAGSNEGAFEKGRRLARLVGERRALLILDGLEPLQYAPTSPTPGEFKDQGIAALLKGLAAANRGLCIVTTRYAFPDLKAFKGKTAIDHDLQRLSTPAGTHLLKTLGVRGTAQEFAALVEDVKGHALTLTLLGGFLKRVFHGDIRQRDRVKFEKADAEMDGGHAFRVLDAYVNWLEPQGFRAWLRWLFSGSERKTQTLGRRFVAVLRLMGLFDRPADAGCLAALRRETIPRLTEPLVGLADDDWEFCLTGLETAKLLTVNRDASGYLVSLDAHPHLREYFARQLRTQHPDVWRAAHRRLYEHLCATTTEGDQPTLEDLQPLYHAVAHGCLAGLQQEAYEDVYFRRIGKGNDAFAVKKLGSFGSDLGAVACFFDEPWNRPSTAFKKYRQAILLGRAAFRLRALGRLTEALVPLRATVELMKRLDESKQLATAASNLSELEQTLGEVAGAVCDAEQAVSYADSSGDAFWRRGSRTTHADALHQAGYWVEAETRFREAEQMQKEDQPGYPLLYSLQGFKYCELLLAAPERAAWQAVMKRSDFSNQPSVTIAHCQDVMNRANKMFEWRLPSDSLLDIALDQLTQGRAAFYAAILSCSHPITSHASLTYAVSSLRRAGQQDYIPLGLLTHAWLRFFEGKFTGPESAQADLDEAWEIAERGPMRLFQADIHLYRARLFFREKDYPWPGGPAADLAAAEAIIMRETTYTRPDGTVIRARYARRDEELADAKRAILSV